MKKRISIVIAILLLLFAGAGYGIGNYFVNYALTRESDSANRTIKEGTEIKALPENERIIKENEEKEKDIAADYEKAHPYKKASIQSKDGLKLNALYQLNNENHEWVILVHGYKSNNENMKGYAYQYALNSYNILLPNNRAHGDSEGTYIGMGWLDKEDIEEWISWIVKQDAHANIVLHGVSMGAAMVMNVAGDNPEHVIGYIEDCGYTSVWDIFSSELDARFSLPSFPVMNLANIVANIKAGYDLKEASSLEQIKKAEKPILFIHGDQDDFVPVSMVYPLYEQANCEKDLYIAKGAGHAQARLIDPITYWNTVFHFIQQKM